MMKFEAYEQYLTGNEARAQKTSAYQAKVEQARAAVEVARIKAEEVIHAEVASGVDKTAEKTAARKAIEKAEQALVYAIEEQTAASSFMNANPSEIRDADVVQAWLNEYRPAVQAEHMPSIQERVKLGQELLLSALHDHVQLNREYSEITEEVRSLNDKAKQGGRQRDYYSIVNPISGISSTGFSPANFSKLLEEVMKGAPLPADVTYRKEVNA